MQKAIVVEISGYAVKDASNPSSPSTLKLNEYLEAGWKVVRTEPFVPCGQYMFYGAILVILEK